MNPGLRNRIFVLLFLQIVWFAGWAQSNLVFYGGSDQLYAPYLNPAFIDGEEKLTLSFFPVGGLSVGYNNQKVNNDMIVDILQGRQTNDSFKGVFRSLLGKALFHQRMEVPLLNLQYRSPVGSFNFRIQDNMRLMTALKGPVSDFLSGPSTFGIILNQEQNFPVHAMYYREYSLGYAVEAIKKKLVIGLRAKLYFGKFSLISDVQGVAVRPAGSEYVFQTRNQLKLSFPAQINQDQNGYLISVNSASNFSVGSFLFNSGNTGMGVDFGLNYNFSPDFSGSLSVTDIGRINWKKDLNSMDYAGEYPFPPEYINVEESDDNRLVRNDGYPASTITIPELFKVELNPSSFSTVMPLTFFAGFSYRARTDLQFCFVDRYVSAGQIGFNSLALTGKYAISRKLVFMTGYAIVGNSFFNIPVAFVRTWSAGQYFIGTDNILSPLSANISDFSGITFGASLFLQNHKNVRKKSVDYLPFFEYLKR